MHRFGAEPQINRASHRCRASSCRAFESVFATSRCSKRCTGMTIKSPSPFRPAGAAIAAVLVLSTPAALYAQDGAPAPVGNPLASPVIVPVNSPVAPSTTPSTPSAPTAPATLPEALRAPMVTPPANPASSLPERTAEMPTITNPLPPVEPEHQAEPTERPRTAAATATTPVVVRRPVRAVAPAAPRAAAPAALPPTPSAAEAIAPLPSNQPLTQVAPVFDSLPAEPALVASQPATGSDNGLADWALFGGLLGIGGIAAAAALSRRRRPDPRPRSPMLDLPHEIVPSAAAPTVTADRESNWTAPRVGAVSAAPLVSASVATLAGARHNRATTTNSGSTSVRQGAGRHEAMVDAGPMPGNPFLTRRKRMIRARFLDRQEAAQDGRRDGWDAMSPRYASR